MLDAEQVRPQQMIGGGGGGVHINGFSVKRRKLEISVYAFYLTLSTKEGPSVFEPAPDAKMGKLTSEE